MTDPASRAGVDAESLRRLVAAFPQALFAVEGEAARSAVAPWPDVVHPEDAPALGERWDHARRTTAAVECVVRLRHGETSYRRVTVRIVPLCDLEGAVLCWVGSEAIAVTTADPPVASCRFIDLLRAAFDHSAEAVFVKDLAGRYLYGNQRCAHVMGADATALIGTDDDRWFGPEVGARLRANDRAVVALGKAVHYDEELSVDDDILSFASMKAPYLDDEGRIAGVFGISRDVGAARREHLAMREERDMYATIADVVPGAFASFRVRSDRSFEVPYATLSVVDLLGASPDELEREPSLLRTLIHSLDWQRVKAALTRSSVDQSLFRCEFRVEHPRHGEIWVEALMGPKREADGSTLWHGFLLDVTERKQGEAVVRAERDRFSAISETVPGALFSYRRGADGQIAFTYVSRSIEDIFGSPADLLLKNPALGFARVHPDDAARARRASQESDTAWHDEFRVLHPTRGEVWVAADARSTRAADGSLIWHGIFVDFSERRQSEAKLRASESTMRSIVETVPDSLIRMGRDGKIQFINRTLPGVDLHQAVGERALDFVAPQMRDGVTATMERVFTTGEVQSYEAAVSIDGSLSAESMRWFNTRVGPVHHDGAVVALTLASTDVTERRRAEMALRDSEERYRTLIELLPDAVLVYAGGKLTYCNAAFVRLMNAEGREQLYGRTHFDIFHLDHHPLIAERLTRMRQRNEAVPPVEVSVVGIDGARRYVSQVATPIADSGETTIVVVLHDLTERKKLEEQFRQAHKMEAFGQLAGGVAHDFNNLLTVILSECALLLTSLPQGAPERGPIREIQTSGERAAGLTRQLLAFSRRTVLEPKVLDLNITVRETEKLLRRLIGEDIRLSTSLAPSLSRVHVDPGQLVQVLMNLVVNARDAMPKGGLLEIATANTILDVGAAERFGLRPGPFVKLSVRDEGTGMTAEVRERMFQPFFTTKSVGQGTGLGLAVVHGIVTQSGGAIEIRSEVGLGTVCDIFLPASRAALSSPAITAVVSSLAPAAGVILVVEDDAALQRLARRILSAKGYTVIVAGDGGEALAVLEQRSAPVDLVITDVVMPTMGGGELGERLRARYPQLKILYVSGYTSDMLVRGGLQSEEVEFLAKPYTPASLGAAVTRILGG